MLSNKIKQIEKESLPIAIFENGSKEVEIKIDYGSDTIWLTQAQIAILFDKDRVTVTEHIGQIYQDHELAEESTRRKFRQLRLEGSRNVEREIEHYNLDMILSIGYRVNSKRATKFRQWATETLKKYLLQGYNLNQKLLKQKHGQILEIQKTLDFLVKSAKNLETGDAFLEILNRYNSSLLVLNKFDENRLKVGKGEKGVSVEIEELRELILKTKQKLIDQKEAGELFGKEQGGKFESTIGAIYQTFTSKDLYTSLEEKAGNLLYLIIKNHAFADGNKRIGSIIFVYFLAKNNFLYKESGELKINDNALVALALLIAQSKPEDKEIMVKLIINLIQN